MLVQIVSSIAAMVNLMCSLNVTIPSTVRIVWLHNGGIVYGHCKTGDTTTLPIQNPRLGDVYQWRV